LLRDVWPLEISVKTSTMSARLCDLAFSSGEHFLSIAELVLPLLTRIDSEHISLPHLRVAEDNIVDLYPRQTLELLHAVLPDDVSAWPWDIQEILPKIGEADESLKVDPKLIELNRKWNSR